MGRRHLSHEEAGFCVQQLGLSPGAEQEGEAAEGERALRPKVVLGRVVCLPPCHIVVLNIQLLAANEASKSVGSPRSSKGRHSIGDLNSCDRLREVLALSHHAVTVQAFVWRGNFAFS